MAAPSGRAPAPAPAEVRPMSVREAAHVKVDAGKLQALEAKSNQKVKDAQERGAKLREHEQQNPDKKDPRSFFDEQRKESAKPLHEVERKALEGYREKPGESKPPKEVQQVLDFDAYVKVERSEEAYKKAGLSPDEAHEKALTDAGFKDDASGKPTAEQLYKSVRDGVMDNLLDQPAVQALIPEVTEFTDQADKRDYVDAVIASDENVRLEVMKRGHSVAEKAMKLPRADASSEQKSAIENAQKARVDAINKRLGLNKNPLKQDDLQDILDQGEAGIKSAMYRKSLEEQNVKEPATAEAYLVNRDDLAAKEAALAKTPNGVDNDRLEQEIAKLRASIKVAESTLGINSDKDRLELAQKDAKAYAAVYGARTRDGSMSGGMDRMACDMVDAARQQQTLETQASANPTPEQEKARIDLQAEAAKAVGEGAFEGKDKSDQEARVIDARKMQAEADVLEKQGKHEAAQAVERLQAQMNEDWVKMEAGNKRSNKVKIGKDMDIYCDANISRQDAIAHIIMGKVFVEGSTVTITDATGEINLKVVNGFLVKDDGTTRYVIERHMNDANGAPTTVRTEARPDNLPQSLLAGQSKDIIDRLVTDQGAAVEQRLLADNLFALKHNNRRDIGDNRNLQKTKEQRQEMMKKAGLNLLKQVQEDANIEQKWKKLLKENHVGMDQNKLMMILMMLLGMFGKFAGSAQDKVAGAFT